MIIFEKQVHFKGDASPLRLSVFLGSGALSHQLGQDISACPCFAPMQPPLPNLPAQYSSACEPWSSFITAEGPYTTKHGYVYAFSELLGKHIGAH